MLGLSFISSMSLDASFISVMQENAWLFIPAFIVLWVSLVLRIGKVWASQMLLLLGFVAAWDLSSNSLFAGLMVLQAGLAVWMLIRLVIDIEWSYSRRLEKTHFAPRNITKGGNAGIREYRF